MSNLRSPLQPYRGEFRYVFYTPANHYAATLAFYRDVLQLPIVGGWDVPDELSHGTYFQASIGIIEVITESEASEFKATLLQVGEDYLPPRGGFILFEVPDVDAIYQHAKDIGAEIVQGVHEWPWGFRDFKVKDPCGNIVSPFSRLGN